MTFRLTAAGLAAALLFAVATPARAGDDWKKEFARQFSSKNSWERWAAIKLLDPNEKDALKQLYEILKKENWYLRGAAIEVLAGAYDAKTVEELKKTLKSSDPAVQEGIIIAFGNSKDINRVDDIVDALKKAKDWHVKRAAALALRKLPDKKGVGPLIDAFEKEKSNFVLWVHVVETLEKITGQKYQTAADWKTWWQGVEKDWTPESANKPAEGEGDGAPKTQVKGTDLDFRSRGKGRPLLVLPDYGYEKDYLETYLRNLEETSQVVYMALPVLSDFKNPPLQNAPNLPAPYYPIERLADTFEELRLALIKDKKLKDQPFAVMGHGLSAWIACKYATKYPKSVSRIVLCSPYSSGKAFSDGINRMIAEGNKADDQELVHVAKGRQFVNGKSEYTPSGQDDGRALERKEFDIYFTDWRDLDIGRLFGPYVEKEGRPMPKIRRPMGSVFIPDYSVLKEPEVPVPTLVMVGANALETSVQDCDTMLKMFPKGKLQVFNKSARMPFIEENAEFTKAMQGFLAK
jgi:pimeloyl-ACP methyl ester carboxylesterase